MSQEDQNRILVAVFKVPSDVTISYQPQQMGSMPDASVNGLLCLTWEYEGPEGCLSNVEARSVIAGDIAHSMSVDLGHSDYTVDQIQKGISEALSVAPLQLTPELNSDFPDNIIQVVMADLSQKEFDELSSGQDDIKFKLVH